MPNVNCPHCQSSWTCAIPPSRCKDCNKPLPTSAVSTGGGLDLMLKDKHACQHCKREFYEEDLPDGICPRCGKTALPEDEGDQDGGGSGRRGPSRGRGRGRKKAGRSKKKVDRKKAPPQKKQVILTEPFKRSVFDAFKRAQAQEAQQLCFELCGENEVYARQIYSHLLGVAKKNGWVGIHRDAVEVTPGPSHSGSGSTRDAAATRLAARSPAPAQRNPLRGSPPARRD